MKPDPASLEALRDIVAPAPVPWWPLAPGWYVVVALFVAGGVYASWHAWRRWKANAHRREALRFLSALDPADLSAHAELVRRTVLAEVPRNQVACLDGTAWTDFLVRTCPSIGLEQWKWMDDVYRAGSGQKAPSQMIRHWIIAHQPREARPC